jgi:hypothetical protein
MIHSLPTAGSRRRIPFWRWPSINGTGVVVCALLLSIREAFRPELTQHMGADAVQKLVDQTTQ